MYLGFCSVMLWLSISCGGKLNAVEMFSDGDDETRFAIAHHFSQFVLAHATFHAALENHHIRQTDNLFDCQHTWKNEVSVDGCAYEGRPMHRCKKAFFTFFLFRACFFTFFNVFLFFQRFLLLKTFIENTIWNHFRNNGNKLGLYDCFSLCPG